jgi:dihydrofolate synthase/folylpolyglutamate synthase
VVSPAYLHALDALCQPVRQQDYPNTLAPMQSLLSALGNPHNAYTSVVVAGSVGKGSTCRRLSALLQASGSRVGCYTSPHLHSFRERFMLNCDMMTQDDFAKYYEQVQAAIHETGHRFSTFEQATALALLWFKAQHAEIAVLEVGIGGRWDAVNVVQNSLAVFTPIEAEHQAMLGGSLESIATHKAGIIQPGGCAVSMHQEPLVEGILQAEADAKLARLTFCPEHPPQGESPISALAKQAWLHLAQRGIVPRRAYDPDVPFLPLAGRLETLSREGHQLVIDGGHTARSVLYLRAYLESLRQDGEPVHLLIGLLSDKNAAAYLQPFDQPGYHLTLAAAPAHRATTPQALYEAVNWQQAQVRVSDSLSDALAAFCGFEHRLAGVAGSLRMAAAAREACGLLDEAALAEAEATRRLFDGAGYLSRLP